MPIEKYDLITWEFLSGDLIREVLAEGRHKCYWDALLLWCLVIDCDILALTCGVQSCWLLGLGSVAYQSSSYNLQAKNEVWPKECPEAIQENRKPIDFFVGSPIKDCSVYYCRVHHFSHTFFMSRDTTSQLKNIIISRNFASDSFFL